MTISEAKAKLIAWCKGQVGYTEGANNWNKYAVGKASAYGWDVQNQPWCDVFCDAGFIECFGFETAGKLTYQTMGAFSALCRFSAQYFKDNGAFFSYPEPGDIIFLIYDGGINHQGIVTDVSGGVVYTVEGNSSDRVRSCAYAVGSSNIAGYGRPRWSIFSSSSSDPTTTGENPVNYPSTTQQPSPQQLEVCTITITLPVVKYKASGEYVKLMQQRLIAKGYSCGIWGADGDYGNGTKQALLNFQMENGLDQDAVCGQRTWSAILNYKG